MVKKPVCFFSIADEKNMKYFKRMESSFKKFHPNIPLLLWGQHKVESYNDAQFYYRATPIIARQLLKDYDLVVKIDSDSIVTGSLTPLIENTGYDMAAPLNFNRVDPPVSVIDIPPTIYFNCGLVFMRNREFVEKWFNLCHSYHFNSYQFREQDLFNIITFYFDWKVKNLDEDDFWCGLISKGEWPRLEVKDGQLVCPASLDRFPDKEMIVKIIHFAGGSTNQDKFDVINTRFSPKVQEFLKGLIRP